MNRKFLFAIPVFISTVFIWGCGQTLNINDRNSNSNQVIEINGFEPQNDSKADDTSKISQGLEDEQTSFTVIDDVTLMNSEMWKIKGLSSDWRDHCIYDTSNLPEYAKGAIQLAKSLLDRREYPGTVIVGYDYVAGVLSDDDAINGKAFHMAFYDQDGKCKYNKNVEICMYSRDDCEIKKIGEDLQWLIDYINEQGWNMPVWILDDGEYIITLSFWIGLDRNCDYGEMPDGEICSIDSEVQSYKDRNFDVVYIY